MDHEKISESPSASLDKPPFKVTVDPQTTVWAGPALATGAVLVVVMVTVFGLLFTLPSFTIN